MFLRRTIIISTRTRGTQISRRSKKKKKKTEGEREGKKFHVVRGHSRARGNAFSIKSADFLPRQRWYSGLESKSNIKHGNDSRSGCRGLSRMLRPNGAADSPSLAIDLPCLDAMNGER